jgi:hypothetical protein
VTAVVLFGILIILIGIGNELLGIKKAILRLGDRDDGRKSAP